MQLSGSTILLTGATGLIGSGLARYFAKHGATLLLSGRDESKLADLARSLDASGEQCNWYVADLCQRDSLEEMVHRIDAAGRYVDMLVNNAADPTSLPLTQTSLGQIDTIVRTNVIGTLQLTRLIVPGMVERKRGVIVNMSSLAGYKADPSQSVYSVSKGALNAMSEALNAELNLTGVRALNVALMGIGIGPRKVPVEILAERLERAIERGDTELFLYRRTKWLMRLYGACPWLKSRFRK